MNYQVSIQRGVLFTLVFLLCYTGKTFGNNSVLKWKNDGITITLQDYLKVPDISWPKTLLEYPVDFSAEPVFPSDIILIDMTNQESIPFQLTRKKEINGKVSSAFLCFFSEYLLWVTSPDNPFF